LPAACSGDDEAGEGRGVKEARRRLGFPPGPPTWGRRGRSHMESFPLAWYRETVI
jgi:hypothetical protein